MTTTPKTLSAAQRNLAKLPAKCYGIVLGNPVGKRVSILHAGMSGYHSTSEPPRLQEMSSAELSAEIDAMNSEDGVTPAQREAMETGSIFGWDCPGADCDSATCIMIANSPITKTLANV